jgi:hypothetical protein
MGYMTAGKRLVIAQPSSVADMTFHSLRIRLEAYFDHVYSLCLTSKSFHLLLHARDDCLDDRGIKHH